MEMEDRVYVCSVLGVFLSVASFLAHTSISPEAALVPIVISFILIVVVWNGLIHLSWKAASVLLFFADLVLTLGLISLLFNVPIL